MNTNANNSGLDQGALTAERVRAMLMLFPSVPDGLRSTSEQVREAIRALPYLQEDDLVALGEKDNACPICIVPFLALIAEEEMARAMDSPAQPVEELGVTRLVGEGRCGHVFCRKDLSKWIIRKNTCPLCRQPLFEPEPRPARAAAPIPTPVPGPGPGPASSASNSSAADAANPASNDTTTTNADPNPNAHGADPSQDEVELEAELGAHFDRFRQLLGRTFEGEQQDGPAPTTTPAPGSAPANTTTNASANAPTGAESDAPPGTRARGTGAGGIGRDLGEGHAHNNADEDEEEDELLAQLLAGMNPQEAQRLRASMAQMRNMFSGSMPLDAMFGLGPRGRAGPDERDEDREQFSGMYS